MWRKLADEMQVPWQAAEVMHWKLGAAEIARRAQVIPFSPKMVSNEPQKPQRTSPTSAICRQTATEDVEMKDTPSAPPLPPGQRLPHGLPGAHPPPYQKQPAMPHGPHQPPNPPDPPAPHRAAASSQQRDHSPPPPEARRHHGAHPPHAPYVGPTSHAIPTPRYSQAGRQDELQGVRYFCQYARSAAND